jgi:dihydroflavonol-4-reductase
LQPISKGVFAIHTILVTGGAGFIGSHTVKALSDRGLTVRCLIRKHHRNLDRLNGLSVDIVRGDLLDPASFARNLEDVDYIIHIAGITKAKRKDDFYIGNVAATQNLLEAALHLPKLKKFCCISSLTAVGPSPDGLPLTESAPCRPITTYGKSKLAAENLCARYADRLPIVILRPPAVFGPGDPDILEIYKLVYRGLHPIIGSPEKTVSLIYAPELAKAIVCATIDDRTAGQTYFVSDPTVYAFSSLIDYLAIIANKRTIPLRIPAGVVYSLAGIVQFFSLFGGKPAILNIEKARDILQKHWVCDPQKIKDHIGFETSVSVYEGIKQTFAWYNENAWL